MSERPNDFEALLSQVQQGDESAVQEFVETYGPHVIRAVRRKLNAQLRKKFDSVDFVQAVWASFFGSCVQMRQFQGSGDLIAFLTTLAGNKVVDSFRKYLKSQKNDLRREAAVDEIGLDHGLQNRDPSPSEIAIARERWDGFMREQPEHYRHMILLRYEGNTFREIADQLKVDERTVRRVIDRLFRDHGK